jgi:hypothetical protein
MIKIGKPFIYEDGEYAYLKASVQISSDTVMAYMSLPSRYKHVHWRLYENYPPKEWNEDGNGLWFAVPKEYKQYLCSERADAFVAAMLWYAMVTESDIESESPISMRMVFGIRYHLVPALMKEENGFHHHIRILCDTIDTPYPNVGAVGTGMSCGVDSIYSLDLYNSPDVPPDYKLTHLGYFNMGAIFHPDRASHKVYSMKEFYETTDKMSEEKLKNAQQVAELSNLSLLYVKSNLDSDYYRGAYGDTGVYRNCACVLAVQGLFNKYYCSSAGSNAFDLKLNKGSEWYESLLCNVLSTESLDFLLSDYATRIEKMETLVSDQLSHKFLDVCFRFNNCGECSKCLRTLVTLDIMGALDMYSEVFDIKKYKSNRTDAFLWLLQMKDKEGDDAIHAQIVYDFAIRSRFAFPKESIAKYKKQKRKNKWKSYLRGVKRLVWPVTSKKMS